MRSVGRFAPTPSGRMHLGNLFSALLAWLSVRSQGGELVLRMEDLDTQRTNAGYASQPAGTSPGWASPGTGRPHPKASGRMPTRPPFGFLEEMGLLYPCYCTRSRLHRIDAPHATDGVYVYDGRCRNRKPEEWAAFGRLPAWRVRVPDREVSLWDGIQGQYIENLARDCGDFVVRRADGVFVYQLAVVVDDAAAGVTEVVRGGTFSSTPPSNVPAGAFGRSSAPLLPCTHAPGARRPPSVQTRWGFGPGGPVPPPVPTGNPGAAGPLGRAATQTRSRSRPGTWFPCFTGTGCPGRISPSPPPIYPNMQEASLCCKTLRLTFTTTPCPSSLLPLEIWPWPMPGPGPGQAGRGIAPAAQGGAVHRRLRLDFTASPLMKPTITCRKARRYRLQAFPWFPITGLSPRGKRSLPAPWERASPGGMPGTGSAAPAAGLWSPAPWNGPWFAPPVAALSTLKFARL